MRRTRKNRAALATLLIHGWPTMTLTDAIEVLRHYRVPLYTVTRLEQVLACAKARMAKALL